MINKQQLGNNGVIKIGQLKSNKKREKTYRRKEPIG